MSEQLRQTFANAKKENRNALVTFMTAGYPTVKDTVPILKGFQDGGVDIILIETIFDTLNAKAAIYAIKDVMKQANKDIPIMISVTLSDKSARTLSGQTLEAFYYSIEFASR